MGGKRLPGNSSHRWLGLTLVGAVVASLAPLSAIAATPPPSARHVVFERPVRQESSALPGGQRGRLQIRQLADSALAVAAASPRQQLPANPVVAASWTPLGPAPERGLTTLCASPPNTATCGSYGNSSGRITSVVTDPANALIAYAGSAGGGVWKTTDGGKNWVPLNDTQASLAIGSLALDPTNGQVIYWLPTNSNTGPSTLNANGGGPTPIVNPNGSPLGANQILANQFVSTIYINGVWQLYGGSGVGVNVGTFGTEFPIASAS